MEEGEFQNEQNQLSQNNQTRPSGEVVPQKSNKTTWIILGISGAIIIGIVFFCS